MFVNETETGVSVRLQGDIVKVDEFKYLYGQPSKPMDSPQKR